jgi:uncharacterized protein (DUF58 family)
MGIGALLQPSAERFGLILTQPFRALRRRMERYIFSRVQRIPGPFAITPRRVYILPTRYGYGYGLLLLVMLVGAMNYSNSMAFALTFLLAGLVLVSMHHTHANLLGIAVRALAAQPVFAGEQARFPLGLESAAPRTRYAICAGWSDMAASASTDIAPNQQAIVTLSLPASRRGVLRAPRFSVVTEFPLGLFHAWTWIELDNDCLVYPAPAPPGSAPPAATGGTGLRTGSRPGQEEFAGLRPYQRGDAAASIHWKSLPKHPLLQVKAFAETLEKDLWLDWAELPAAWDVERRLSQLTRWVLDSDGRGLAYGLRLPGSVRPPARGELHRQECLRALALFEAKA